MHKKYTDIEIYVDIYLARNKRGLKLCKNFEYIGYRGTYKLECIQKNFYLAYVQT